MPFVLCPFSCIIHYFWSSYPSSLFLSSSHLIRRFILYFMFFFYTPLFQCSLWILSRSFMVVCLTSWHSIRRSKSLREVLLLIVLYQQSYFAFADLGQRFHTAAGQLVCCFQRYISLRCCAIAFCASFGQSPTNKEALTTVIHYKSLIFRYFLVC